MMVDQLVIEQRILVQRVSQGLAIVPVMVLPDGALIYNAHEREIVVPGRPMDEITPLEDHRDEVVAIVWRTIDVGPSPAAIS